MAADGNGYLGRHFRDEGMHTRIIAAVERALATAEREGFRVFHDNIEGYDRTYCSLALRHDPDMFARRVEIYGGVAYELVLCVFEGERESAEARTNLAALVRTEPENLTGPVVAWQWGSGSPDESSAVEYLDWWEKSIDRCAAGTVA
jgi:hypothetical protein